MSKLPTTVSTNSEADAPPCSARSFDVGISLIEAMNTISRAVPVLCKTCQWSEDKDSVWDTACGQAFSFATDGPVENSAKFCLFCGGELIAVSRHASVNKNRVSKGQNYGLK